MTLFGLAATGWGVEQIVVLRAGETHALGPFTLVIEEIMPRQGPNYREVAARMAIREAGVTQATIHPSRRTFATRQMTTTEAGIATLGFGQVYVSLADQRPDGGFDARLYWKPYVALIWIGALIMALGGLCSVADRRLRIGVARRAKAAAEGAHIQPAE